MSTIVIPIISPAPDRLSRERTAGPGRTSGPAGPRKPAVRDRHRVR